MTLILTELSSFGVAMAADSAVTFSDGRVYVGAQKLLPVYELNAGVSIWGLGRIGKSGGRMIDSDIWLQQFIENKVVKKMSLWDMAIKLADELNKSFGGVASDRMGGHIAGFDEKDGVRGPAFYHTHNGHYKVGYINGKVQEIPGEQPPIREFRAHRDCAPAIYKKNKVYLTRNGDFSIFALLYDIIIPLFANVRSMTGLKFPYPSGLEGRGEYLRFWIDTIVGIYRLSSARKRILPQPATAGDASIGGPITVLTISKSGIESFYTR